MKNIFFISKSLTLLLFLSMPLISQKLPSTKSNESLFLPDCQIDHEKFCKDITQLKAKIAQCLLEHNDNLSDVCKSSLKYFSDKMRSQTKGTCKVDVDKFCKWVIPGGGRILKCLFKNEASLSDTCRKVLNE